MNKRKFVSTGLLTMLGLSLLGAMINSGIFTGLIGVGSWVFMIWGAVLLRQSGQKEEKGEMLNTYELFIKHSLNEPDIQVETKARNLDEAVDEFANSKYFGELGKAEIRNKITEIR